jgi:hypothetical protein
MDHIKIFDLILGNEFDFISMNRRLFPQCQNRINCKVRSENEKQPLKVLA